MNPLINLNERNVGVMIKGRSYDFTKPQYRIHTISNRDEAIRTIIILDTSGSMAGEPFKNARIAISRFIDGKRRQDQVAIIALADNDKGYEIVSNFERDNVTLGNRLADLKANSKKTRLYDALGAAIQLIGSAYVGGITSSEATYIASSSIIVFSDGHDTGSAVTRDDLMTRISNLAVPVPIYTLAYTQSNEKYLGNLQAISKNAFGKYYGVNETLAKMTTCVEKVHDILRNDYVVTLRAYIPIDGEFHSAKLGIEYPSNSGNILYESFKFESIEPPPTVQIQKALGALNTLIPALPDNNPYFSSGTESVKKPQ